MKFAVIGGGQQGLVIARALAENHEVHLLDLAPASGNWTPHTYDASRPETLEARIAPVDLVVGALPSHLSHRTAKAVIQAQKSLVDVAFAAENLRELHAQAVAQNVCVLPDFGLAPGLTNFLAGRAAHTLKPQRLLLQVGGVAIDKNAPFGYTRTWSLEDLLEEYIRPARYKAAGKTESAPAFSEKYTFDIAGVGTMEAFLTDGTRSLLDLPVDNIREETLRWPGHVDAVRPLVENNTLIETLTQQCETGKDRVVLRVEADDQTAVMTSMADNNISAMAKTTALTTATVAEWVAETGFNRPGVHYPEDLASDDKIYTELLDRLEKRDIRFTPPRPFKA